MNLEQFKEMFAPNTGASLDVPHPLTLGRPEERPMSAWVDSVDPEDIDGGANRVTGRIIELMYLDKYGEPVGKSEFILQHKYDHPQRRSTDVSATLIRPRTLAGERNQEGKYTMLPPKKRFPLAFEQFERRMREAERPLPLALLDSVPPEVLEALLALGVHSIDGFAVCDEVFLAQLAQKLEQDQHTSRARNVVSYRDRAATYLGELPKRRKVA